MNDRRRAPLALEPRASELPRRIVYHGARWLPLVVLAILTYLLYPVVGGFDAPIYEVGEVAPGDVVAPFAFVVRKTPAQMEREADALAATVRPIYDLRQEAVVSIHRHVNGLFTAMSAADSVAALMDTALVYDLRLTADEAEFLLQDDHRSEFRRALRRLVQRDLARGVARLAPSDAETAREIVVRRDGTDRVIPVDSAPGWVELLERRRAVHPAPNSVVGDQLFVKLLIATFQPTLVPNVLATDSLRAELRAQIDTVKDRVRNNERIVAEHEVVTTEANDRMVALRTELLGHGGAERLDVPAALGRVLANALILSIFWLLLLLYRHETYSSLRQVLVIFVLFGIVVLGAAANLRFVSEQPELIPIPFAAMLIAVLFGGRVAMIAAAVLAVLITAQPVYGGPAALYITLLTGVAAAIGIRVVRRRAHILGTVAIVSGAFALVALTAGLQSGWSVAEVAASAGRGTINAVVSAALVSIGLPLFESMGRVTTDVTLLELSDPSRPLLRRLATEASGTYAHSIAMANLCEAACNAIGANGLLARVGCYYHDVGKLKKPQFFVENQSPGANPHDKLKPDVSATIIRNHVKEGLALADDYGLPDVVRAFIPEHHGTAEITYFLDRARTRGEDDPSPECYRYPGPRPRSVETAVAMLADGVEAAVRVLADPSPERVHDVIDHLARQRVEAGQLNDAPLTLAQLDRVKQEFVQVLTGIHHNRIDYPAATGGIRAEWDRTTV